MELIDRSRVTLHSYTGGDKKLTDEGSQEGSNVILQDPSSESVKEE